MLTLNHCSTWTRQPGKRFWPEITGSWFGENGEVVQNQQETRAEDDGVEDKAAAAHSWTLSVNLSDAQASLMWDSQMSDKARLFFLLKLKDLTCDHTHTHTCRRAPCPSSHYPQSTRDLSPLSRRAAEGDSGIDRADYLPLSFSVTHTHSHFSWRCSLSLPLLPPSPRWLLWWQCD